MIAFGYSCSRYFGGVLCIADRMCSSQNVFLESCIVSCRVVWYHSSNLILVQILSSIPNVHVAIPFTPALLLPSPPNKSPTPIHRLTINAPFGFNFL